MPSIIPHPKRLNNKVLILYTLFPAATMAFVGAQSKCRAIRKMLYQVFGYIIMILVYMCSYTM